MEDLTKLTAEDRLQYTEAANQQTLEFDSRLLWFSGGGLVAVATLAGTLKMPPSCAAIVVVSLGALFLLGSSGLTLYSFQKSAHDIAAFLDKPSLNFRKQQMASMRRLNITSLVFMLVGLALLAVFAVLVMLSSNGVRA